MKKARLPSERRSATILVGLVQRKVGTTDRNEIDCPRAKTSMTPCVARDGSVACTDEGDCVGCWRYPTELLREFRRAEEARRREPPEGA